MVRKLAVRGKSLVLSHTDCSEEFAAGSAGEHAEWSVSVESSLEAEVDQDLTR